MKKKPLVTIAIPSYNHQKYIGETINSAIVQDYNSLEIIIIDDKSTDNSIKIISDFRGERRVRKIIFHRENMGMTRTFNHCLMEAKGEYVLLLGSDDLLEPGIIKRQIRIFNKYPTVGVVHTGVSVIDEGGRPLKQIIGHDLVTGEENYATRRSMNKDKKYINSIKYPKDDVIKKQIKGSYIHHPSCLVSKKCFEKIGYFNEKLSFQDYDFWFRVLKYFDVYFIKKPLLKYRHHSTNFSISDQYLNNKEKIDELVKIISGLCFNDIDLDRAKEKKLNYLRKFYEKYENN